MNATSAPLIDYSRLNHGSASQILQPADAEAASADLKRVRDHISKGTGVTIGGAGRSFGGQALPPEHLQNRVLLKTTAMDKVTLLPESDTDKERHVRRAVVGAGVTFGALLEQLNHDDVQYMPFSTPTSRFITVAGALSANTHSRTTSARGGYLFDHVHAFTLVTPDLGPVHCRRDAPVGSLPHTLFFAAPGSFGALGVITDVEMELRELPKDATVHCATLHVSGSLDDFLAAMERIHAENRATNTWDEGIFVLLYGSPSQGHGGLVGCQTGTAEQKEHLHPMPMFAERPTRNAYYHGIGNAYPRLAMYMMEREFGAGNEYLNDLNSFSYFLSSHDAGHALLAGNTPMCRALRVGGVDPDLPTAHQAWAVPTAALGPFMRVAGALLDGPYADILPLMEMQDILDMPHSDTLMSPCKEDRQWLYQFSFVAPDKGGPKTQRIRAFFKALSTAAAVPPLGARVYLLKESQCDDPLLRLMHEPALSTLRTLKATTDSRNVLTSDLLARLFPAPPHPTEDGGNG